MTDEVKLYRVRFKLCSSVVTPLKGDTIWGHIVWGIANHEGDEAVDKFIEQEKSDPPALVVSSAFPEGLLCRDLPLPPERKESMDTEEYTKIKKEKKIKYMPASKYFEGAEAPHEKMNDVLDKDKVIPVMHKTPVMRNTIDRSDNTVLGGGLYSNEEKWSGILKNDIYTSVDWDIYILSSFAPDRVEKLVEWAFENGYGADASTGKGKIEILSSPIQVKPKKGVKEYMALGPFVGTEKIKNIRADIFVRSGKLGGSFASSLLPHKKPVVLYDEGAVFECDTEINYAGTLLEKMHVPGKYNICQSGFAPVIPLDHKD